MKIITAIAFMFCAGCASIQYPVDYSIPCGKNPAVVKDRIKQYYAIKGNQFIKYENASRIISDGAIFAAMGNRDFGFYDRYTLIVDILPGKIDVQYTSNNCDGPVQCPTAKNYMDNFIEEMERFVSR